MGVCKGEKMKLELSRLGFIFCAMFSYLLIKDQSQLTAIMVILLGIYAEICRGADK